MLTYRQRAEAAADDSQLTDYSPVLRQLLSRRGITTPRAAEEFLHPSVKNMHDPLQLQNMSAAVERIRTALAAGEHICVYGDYDCDGVTSASILSMYLRSCGAEVEVYIPSRHLEGYGLNMKALQGIIERCSLIITVDCGISNVQEVAYVKGAGRDIIVTDHHQLPPELPGCICIDPLMGDYPWGRLCGAGVALKLVQALGGEQAAEQYWDLAAIGTVADIVPLLDENRIIVTEGLKRINARMRPGLSALCRAAGLKSDNRGSFTLSAGQIAFNIAPRINAGGRMETAARCVELLTCGDERRASELAEYINLENADRQSQEREVLDAVERSLLDMDFTAVHALIVCGEGWNPGVIGLAASRLKEKYNYPTLVFTRKDDNYVGSCRSIEGVDIFKALSACRDLFSHFGGHPMAAGLTLPVSNMPALISRLNAYLAENAPRELYAPSVEYDLELGAECADLELVRALAALQPTGCGNPEPTFRLQGTVAGTRVIGQSGAHLRLDLDVGGSKLTALAWGMAGRRDAYTGARLDMVCTLGINTFNGVDSPQAIVRDMQPPTPADAIRVLQSDAPRAYLEMLDGMLAAAAPCEITPEQLTESQLSALLARDPQGTLIDCDTPAEMRRLLIALCGNGLTALPDICAGVPTDRRAFNALCLCVNGAPLKGYKYYVAVGRRSAQRLKHLQDAGLRVFTLQWTSHGAPLRLDDDGLRSVYKQLAMDSAKLSGYKSAVDAAVYVASAVNAQPAQALAALHIFRELGLLELDKGVNMLPMHKVRLSDSYIYRALEN